jgi:hypothetical protein
MSLRAGLVAPTIASGQREFDLCAYDGSKEQPDQNIIMVGFQGA